MKNGNGTRQLILKRNHSYNCQILTHLVVSGLEWCDLFVWCTNYIHQETVYMTKDVWISMKNKIDKLFFDHFILLMFLLLS